MGSKAKNILVAACEAPATKNFQKLCSDLTFLGNVKTIVTKDAVKLMNRAEIARDFELYGDDDDDLRAAHLIPLHIELAQWAKVLVIAPIDANTMAKISGGFCNDLLTKVVKAWEYKKKALFFAPDVHPLMWSNPSTKSNLQCLGNEFGGFVIPTVADSGLMAMHVDIVA